MSTFDYEIVQGDTAPVYTDTLTFDDDSPVNLTGATVQWVMRSLLSAAPLTITGIVTITGAAAGGLQYAPSATDTAVAGDYMAQWKVTLASGQVMTFPTTGYISVRVHENLVSAGGQQLVSLPDLKDYLSIPAGDRTRDAKLVRFIRAARPVVENITGPIVPTVYDELHDGGASIIQIRRRPSTTYDTTPVLDLLVAEEIVGSNTRTLTVVTSAALGTTYSCMIDSLGTITRRTSGGGSMAFAAGSQNVHIQYRAGQSSVPPNVYEGTLELLRVNYSTTQGVGRARLAPVDDLEAGSPLGFYMPRRIRELLAPMRRAPAVA